ncbi:uncharacterized protein LOC107966034 isoform X2 [Apis mellifera]|uniref:Uncharacterized protein LOC107966034 isoform X2 n=1 Tax=Apis mellifera TaxID=7460 RepID=A0A7M7MV09_APIME|nr:uncharacterized protein LOC107966034 isoform X2 [Apis mellifera]|eukprot:XP_026301538.1 uncharacterized protein LOC107966034 isoform X2 [Apis mellifera]
MLKMDINLTLNSLSYTSCTCICIMKYFNCLFHIKDIKNFLDEIKNDWNSLRNIEELRIIHEYSKTIKKITICFVIIIVPLQLVFFLNVFGNNILDILIPLNHTRPRTVPIEIYYFIDQQKFFFFFGMHLNIITSFGGLVYIAIETIYMGMIQHLCGLLKITSYINWIQEKIIITYDLLILLGLIAFSIFIFELAKSITSRTNTNEIFSSLIFVICITIYGFIPNHFAQEIINHSSNIFIDTYNTEWYKLPIIEQKLLLFIMQNNLKNLNFVLLGTMIASYNVYVMILRTAFSYFMVIYSMD